MNGRAAPSPSSPVALQVFQGIAAAAGLIAALKDILTDSGALERRLDSILTELQQLREAVVTATADILEAIDGVRRQIDENDALDNMSLADRALFSDLIVFGDQQEAMGGSFQAASRLERETDLVFAGSFMYVVNIRLTIMKAFDPNFFCVRRYQEEFEKYRGRLAGWTRQWNELVERSHTAVVVLTARRFEEPGEPPVDVPFWLGWHARGSTVVATFRGPLRALDETTRLRVLAQADASRRAGIEQDRREFGVVAAEDTVAAWEKAFSGNLRSALVTGLLNRPAPEADPDALRVDGQLLLADPTLRSTLLDLLTSREFQGRLQASWAALLERGDDRLVQLAYHRLFERDATGTEVDLLRGVASTFGYGAFTTMLLTSTEYEERYGNGLPTRAGALELPS